MFPNINIDDRVLVVKDEIIDYEYNIGDIVVFYAPPVSYTHLRAHETRGNLVCRLLLEKKVNLIENALKSPIVGTAYLSPEPSAKKFIEEGQSVKIGQVLLIIEAMKTMNEITADKNGKVKKIFVKNESPVEFGEPLVLIE